MGRKVILSPRAIEDLESIVRYIAARPTVAVKSQPMAPFLALIEWGATGRGRVRRNRAKRASCSANSDESEADDAVTLNSGRRTRLDSDGRFLVGKSKTSEL